MSRFKRVVESSEIPDYISDQFFPQDEPMPDPYAELRAGARERKGVIAREQLGYEAEARVKKTASRRWTPEVEEGARYRAPRMAPVDDELSNLDYADVSGHGIRRVGAAVDEGVSARNLSYSNIRLMGEGEEMQMKAAILDGGRIFDPDMEAMEAYCADAMAKRVAFQNRQERNARNREAAHTEWEVNARRGLRPRKTVMARSHAALRIGDEYTAAGAFGLPDYEAVKAQEAARHEMIDHRREAQLSIKRKGYQTREARHDEWEREHSSESLFAQRVQDYEASLGDSFDRVLSGQKQDTGGRRRENDDFMAGHLAEMERRRL